MSAITDYLTLFFRQRHINKMPEPTWRTFVTYHKNDGFRGHMEAWFYDLTNRAKGQNGEDVPLERKGLPDATKEFKWTPKYLKPNGDEHQLTGTLSESDWKELYNLLQNIFIRMHTNMIKNKADNDNARRAATFVKDFYDPDPAKGKLFSLPAMNDDIKSRIEKFTNLLSTPGAEDIAKSAFSDKGDQTKQLTEFRKFVDKMKNRKYLTDADVRKRLLEVLDTWENTRIYSSQTMVQEVQDLFTKSSGLNLKQLAQDLRAQNEVTPEQMDRFKGTNGAAWFTTAGKENLPMYQAILTRVHDDSYVYKEFEKCEEYGDKDISESLEKAKALTDYTGKADEEDEVIAEVNDQKNFIEQLKDDIEDTYKDTFKKWRHLHRDHVYFSHEAQFVMEAIDKLKDDNDKPIKITPKDGIAAIVKNADAIKKAVAKKNEKAKKHFEWFIKALDGMKPRTKKAFAGALRDGKQMQRIVEELIIKAVDTGVFPQKIDEAKTAMEILTVMQYGTFTSRTMDAIKDTKFSLLSDDKLSWNKNAGIRFITGALDKTIKFGVTTAGYAATAATNRLWRRIGKKFGNDYAPLQENVESENKKLTDKRDYFDKKRTEDDKFATEEIARQQATMQRLDDELKDLLKELGAQNPTALTRDSEDLTDYIRKEKAKLEQPYKQASKDLAEYDEFKDRVKKIWEIKDQIHNIEQYSKQISNNGPSGQIQKMEDMNKQKQLKGELSVLLGASTQTELKKKFEEIWLDKGQNGKTLYATALEKKKELQDKKDKLTSLESNLKEYKSAQAEIAESKAGIADREKKANEWDDKNKNNYIELMAYWDFLQTGKTKNLFHISTKKLQAKMDAEETYRVTSKDGSGKDKKMSLMEYKYMKWKAAHGYDA